MRVVALVCLMFVAGSCAMPQSDVAVSEDRIVDLWILDMMQRYRTFIKINGLAPLEIEKHDFDVEWNIFNQLVEIQGFVESFKFTGLDDTRIHDLRYNILLGLLNIDIEFVQLAASIGKYSVRVAVGERIVNLEIKGSFAISGIRFAGEAIIEARPGYVNILFINPNCRIGFVQADLTVVGAEDYSDTVNDFINITLPALLDRYSGEINDAIARLIRRVVEWNWPRL